MSQLANQSLLFLSCDLTGSTDFKQRAKPSVPSKSSHPWQKFFLQFYREFPQEIASSQAELGTTDLDFNLWKPVGDELIYTCKVAHERDIHSAVRTWIHAMKAYRKRSLGDTPMSTKGGAFVATFPGPDSQSTVPRKPEYEKSGRDVVELNREALEAEEDPAKFLYDYFGPSIDTGFRVLSRCSERHFTLSVEVAFALACLSVTPGPEKPSFGVPDIHLLESDSLKGVWDGQRYPLFALDLEHESPINQAFALFDSSVTNPDDVLGLCEACYASPGWPFKLYLPKSSNDHFLTIPEDPLASYLANRDGDDGEVKPREGGSRTASGDELPMG